MGIAAKKSGNYQKAEEYYRESLGIRKAKYGERSHEVSINLNNLGLVLFEQKKYDESLEYYKESLQIRDHLFGPKTINSADLLVHIGNIHAQKNEIEKALEHYEDSLSIKTEAFKEDHPQIKALKTLIQETKEKHKGLNTSAKANSPYSALREVLKKAITEKHDSDVLLKFSKKEDAKAFSNLLNDQQSLFAALNPDQLKVCQQTTETAMEPIYVLTLPEDVYNDLKIKISQ